MHGLLMLCLAIGSATLVNSSNDAVVRRAGVTADGRVRFKGGTNVRRVTDANIGSTPLVVADESIIVDLSSTRPYSAFCRKYDQEENSWEACSADSQRGFQHYHYNIADLVESQAVKRTTPLSMLSQDCISAGSRGKWETSQKDLPVASLGSHSRYAGKPYYLGPMSALMKQPREIRARPHAAEFTEASRPDELATTPEFVWTPSEDPRQKCPKFTWVNQQETEQCLAGTWIAFWGDSTTRMTFSALADFLGGGIETTDLPTHDFTYKEHWSQYDHCGNNNCHMALHFPKHDILLTFNFVTSIAQWPDLNTTLAHYTDSKVFPELAHASPRSQPDLVIMNSGPWEYYKHDAPTKATNDAYVELLRTFLTKNFGADSRTNLIVARNTACPQHKGMCDMSKVPCLDAMDSMHRIQDRVLSEFVVQEGDVQNGRVRYVGGMYTKIVPEGYQCAGEDGYQTGFHLPGVITDMRLNHALHAVCRK